MRVDNVQYGFSIFFSESYEIGMFPTWLKYLHVYNKIEITYS